jgi:hypothetical protein
MEAIDQRIQRLKAELTSAQLEKMKADGVADFSFIQYKMDRDFLEDAFNAITEAGLWEWLAAYEPKQGEGFMFSGAPEISIITKKMHLGDAHSGASFGLTMRNMQYIAKNGLEAFKDLWLRNNQG